MEKHRALICGDREWADGEYIYKVLVRLGGRGGIEAVIEGEARGADRLGKVAALQLGIPVEKFPADWTGLGKAAGPIRNQQMLDEGHPTIVLAFHDHLDQSKGTADMLERAEAANIPIQLFFHGRMSF